MVTWLVGVLEEVLRGERSSVGREGREGEMAVQVGAQQMKNNLWPYIPEIYISTVCVPGGR